MLIGINVEDINVQVKLNNYFSSHQSRVQSWVLHNGVFKKRELRNGKNSYNIERPIHTRVGFRVGVCQQLRFEC